jgi:hypothetical protein
MYLRRFKRLRLLNLDGNPVSRDMEYRAYVIAHIKGLKYLDYRLIESAQVVAAREQYQEELVELEEREKMSEESEVKEREAAVKQAEYRVAAHREGGS